MLIGIGRLLKGSKVYSKDHPPVYYLYVEPRSVFIPKTAREGYFSIRSNTDWTVSILI